MMSSPESTSDPAQAAEPERFTGFDEALLLEALAQVERARVAAETVFEANIRDALAAA